jgi:acyl-CoA synthetase (NDP forming)
VASGGRWLLEPDGRELLARFGLPIPASRVVETPAAAVAAWRELGGPVVLKAVSRALLHKSDRGGVMVGLDAAGAVEAGAGRLLALCRELGDPDGRVLVTRRISGGVELIVGAFRDIHYGPTLMVGAGGVLAEIMQDSAFRFPPLSSPAIETMLDGLRIAPLLAGARGRPACDRPALVRLLHQVGRLILTVPEIAEIDLNPVFALPDGAAVADVRIILHGSG